MRADRHQRRPVLSTHRCMAVACQHQVPANLLMCNDHWRQVPEKLRHEVWLQYRRCKANPDAMDVRRAHQRAVQAAIDAVHTKQVKAKARRDAGTKPLF